MIVQVAYFTPYGSEIAIVLVEPTHTEGNMGAEMLQVVEKYIPRKAIMLISIQDNGYRAYATFETGILLALLQLEIVSFDELDISQELLTPDAELPF